MHAHGSAKHTADGETGYPADAQFELRNTFINPMVGAAMPLFGMAMRLQQLESHHDIQGLYKKVHNQVLLLVEDMRQRGYDPAHVQAYSYGLCLFLDETVMRTPWGNHSCWSQRPLLSDFHQETWGGEKFFTVLSRMMLEPQRFQQVLEFMYVCLSLGLKGKYAIEPRGDDALQAIIVSLHKTIRDLRGPTPDFPDALENVAPRNFRMPREWPWWTPLAASVAAMAVAYGIYRYRLDLITEQVLQSLNGILH
nr:type IVB secretion system protein IcmH/DotU [Pseudomonas sp. Teo4]